MKTYFFFDGRTGLIERYQGGAYVRYDGMGFHLVAVRPGLFLNAIRAAMF